MKSFSDNHFCLSIFPSHFFSGESATVELIIQRTENISRSQAMQGCGIQSLPIRIGMEKMMNGFCIVELLLQVVSLLEMYLSGRESASTYTTVV
jgi:hypothetical protein